jgi:hypothetical protein
MKLPILASFAALWLLVSTFAGAESSAQKSYSQLKVLAGSWTGTNSAGGPLSVSFRETSAGSALLNEVHVGNSDAEDMISMFHLDGSRLMLTHYCTAGNQPRMVGHASRDGRTITFDFLDATNLPNWDDGHMWRVVFSLLDANHHTETWIYLDHGKNTTEVYDLHRRPVATGQAGQR